MIGEEASGPRGASAGGYVRVFVAGLVLGAVLMLVFHSLVVKLALLGIAALLALVLARVVL
jgi:hypothetical protein